MGLTTRYTYDEVGDKLSQTDANGHTTKLAYDSMKRLIQRTLPAMPAGYTNPSAQSEFRTYDALGRLATMTDNNGLVTTLAYDPQSGYLTNKSATNGDWVSFDYMPDGS
jgi:YD repeat-containing protein